MGLHRLTASPATLLKCTHTQYFSRARSAYRIGPLKAASYFRATEMGQSGPAPRYSRFARVGF